MLTISLKSYKAVIFDMDGTMINNAAHHKLAWQTFLKQHGLTMTSEEFRHRISGKKNDQIIKDLFGEEVSDEDIQRYGEDKEALYRELFKPDIKEINGLTKVVNELLARGMEIAIATTAPPKNRDFALEELGLTGKFGLILGEEHVTNGKPNPEIYLKTAEQLGVEPSQCLVFEDSPPGVAAGKSAGMTVVGILSSHTPDELSEADYTVEDFSAVSFSH